MCLTQERMGLKQGELPCAPDPVMFTLIQHIPFCIHRVSILNYILTPTFLFHLKHAEEERE